MRKCVKIKKCKIHKIIFVFLSKNQMLITSITRYILNCNWISKYQEFLGFFTCVKNTQEPIHYATQEECPICYNALSKNNKTIFGCDHQACSTCIHYLMQNNENLKCCLCRKPIQILFVFSKESVLSLIHI